jgi:multiple sugar transport system substrate-binding protein
MKKILLGMLVLMTGAVFIFGGGQSGGSAGGGSSAAGSSGAVTIRWAYWGGDARIQSSQAAIDVFQAANPGIIISMEPSSGTGDHFNKVDTQIAGGNGPDIIQYGGNFPDGAKRGILLPLEQYVGSGKAIDTSKIDAGTIETGTYEGHVYGISTGVVMPALIYNKTMLEKAGVPLPKATMTWDELRAYLVSVKPKLPAGVYPMQDFGSTSSGSIGFGYWLRWNGTPIYDDVSGTTKVTPAEAKKFLDQFKDYRDNGLVPPADISAGYAETNSDSSSFVAGKVAIAFIVTSQFKSFQQAATDEFGLIEPPGAAATKALWPQLSSVYTVNRDTKHIDAVIKFINFLVTSPDAGKFIGTDRGISASPTFRAGALQGNVASEDQKVFAYLDIATPHSSPETPHLPNDTELNSTLNLIYQRVAFGQINTTQGGQEIYDLLVRLSKK